MYIKEVSIDGFKSYAQRVTLNNFDKGFNAITGLNGSGKSNILDSICFVLGIKNLQQVRAQTLQELVYKQGTAGITKATVSIVFHNDDPANGPSGYEDKEYITVTRQIVIGGRDKYLINGKMVNQGRVADMFQSVQLNVNNPHFLIMQGRVTKIMNMKPHEILGLLEEASGTKLYERKKDAALKTLSKKQSKLDEIDQLMDEELLPTLAKLREEKERYHEYAATTQHHERLKRLCIAYEYTQCTRMLDGGQHDMEALATAASTLDTQRGDLLGEMADKAGEVAALQAEKEIQAGGEVRELQEQADALSLSLTKDTTTWRNKSESLDSERAALAQLKAALAELAEGELATRCEAAQAARDEAQAALLAAQQSVEASTRELAGVEAGDGRDESNRSLQERLADARTAQTAAEAEAKAADIRAKHLAKQMAQQRRTLASKDEEAVKLRSELASATQSVEECQARLQAMGYDEGAAQQLEAVRQRQAAAVRAAKEAVERLAGQLGGLDFNYRDPERGWDRTRVKGVVAKLVHVKEPSAATALEVAAGGRLYQVVVDTERTAKALLERGGLTSRITIIPLNQVRYQEAEPAAVAAARQLVGDRATPAIQLVGYDGDVAAAVRYAFGAAFVCQDAGTARKLAFSREVAKRSITLEGDDFNPGGLLTGGSRNATGSMLTRLHELAAAEAALAQHQSELAAATAELSSLAAAGKEHSKLQQQLELKQHSLALLRERIAGSESAQLADALAASEAEEAEARAAAEAARAKKAELAALAKSLEAEIASFGRDRGARVKGAKAKLAAAKGALDAAKKALKAHEHELASATAEQEAAAEERTRLQRQVATAEASISALEAEVDALSRRVAAANDAYSAAAARLAAKRQRLRECDEEVRALEKERSRLAAKVAELEVERRRLDSRIAGKRGELGAASDRMAALEKDFDWIAREKRGFGTGEFDFDALDIAKVAAEYEETDRRVAEYRERGINRQAEMMYRRNEQEVASLQEKREQVRRDKRQIEGVIGELDEKKRSALQDTWGKVDRDFGAIMSTLLPGTVAKLVPPPGGTFLDGLEVRVGFGDVWKESLTELSGGQRSLLALSLILALCRFKPAPIYILDEVDAALDLNHTQNIGSMIKQHFPESQFVVVSLKEGMFNNASVLFRTRFVDGVSNVMRTAHDAAAAARGRSDRENQVNTSKAGASRGGARGRQALSQRENVA